MGIAGSLNDAGSRTMEVKSFPPNDYGLYDMAGNVAEWVADVYRPIIDDEYNDFNYYRGNVYFKKRIGEDGKASIIPNDQLVYDTLPNGRVILKKLPGQLDQVAIDEEETFLRQNFSESDNRNFRDGDRESSREYAKAPPEDGEVSTRTESSAMYDAPAAPQIIKDENGRIVSRITDKSNKRNSLITDEVRVYKGGSWKDRAYWLDPSQRRFMPQYIATEKIAFTCPKTTLGTKTQKKKTSQFSYLCRRRNLLIFWKLPLKKE